MKKLLSLAVAGALCLAPLVSAQAVELSAAAGVTGQGDLTLRVGAGFDWGTSWWESPSGRLTGYWDAGYTYWEGGDHSDSHSLSFAPVFVYEFAGSNVKPFIEAGIGVAAFSDTRVGDQELGSSFNFENRLGVGLKFADQRIGVRAIHYSNAGIEEPNDGVESYSLFYATRF